MAPLHESGTESEKDIELEFGKLLEALSTGPEAASRDRPQCISCDKPVQQPYVTCQSCGNPLCEDCNVTATQSGHPRRCPTCALLQRYSQSPS